MAGLEAGTLLDQYGAALTSLRVAPLLLSLLGRVVQVDRQVVDLVRDLDTRFIAEGTWRGAGQHHFEPELKEIQDASDVASRPLVVNAAIDGPDVLHDADHGEEVIAQPVLALDVDVHLADLQEFFRDGHGVSLSLVGSQNIIA